MESLLRNFRYKGYKINCVFLRISLYVFQNREETKTKTGSILFFVCSVFANNFLGFFAILQQITPDVSRVESLLLNIKIRNIHWLIFVLILMLPYITLIVTSFVFYLFTMIMFLSLLLLLLYDDDNISFINYVSFKFEFVIATQTLLTTFVLNTQLIKTFHLTHTF